MSNQYIFGLHHVIMLDKQAQPCQCASLLYSLIWQNYMCVNCFKIDLFVVHHQWGFFFKCSYTQCNKNTSRPKGDKGGFSQKQKKPEDVHDLGTNASERKLKGLKETKPDRNPRLSCWWAQSSHEGPAGRPLHLREAEEMSNCRLCQASVQTFWTQGKEWEARTQVPSLTQEGLDLEGLQRSTSLMLCGWYGTFRGWG